MQLPNIKSYTGGSNNNPLTFFVLCKGENSGKPLTEPCPNCFVVTCATVQDREYWFWLSWGLWRSKSFHIVQRGSVIPFIRICDYLEVITRACRHCADKPEQLSEALSLMKQLEQLEKVTLQKLLSIKDMRVAIFHRVLRRE